MTWPIHGLPLGALGLWFKLRLYRSRWPRKAPTVAFAYRWGGRERIRAWLSELAAASLVELRRGDEPLDAVTGPAESIVVVVRHWEPPIPEAISRSRQRWRLRKRRQSERLTPSFTPSATPPSNSERGGTDGQGRRAREISKSAEVENFSKSVESSGGYSDALRKRVSRAVAVAGSAASFAAVAHVGRATVYRALRGHSLTEASATLLSLGCDRMEKPSGGT